MSIMQRRDSHNRAEPPPASPAVLAAYRALHDAAAVRWQTLVAAAARGVAVPVTIELLDAAAVLGIVHPGETLVAQARAMAEQTDGTEAHAAASSRHYHEGDDRDAR